MKSKITPLFNKRNRRISFLNWASALVLALSLWGGQSYGQDSLVEPSIAPCFQTIELKELPSNFSGLHYYYFDNPNVNTEWSNLTWRVDGGTIAFRNTATNNPYYIYDPIENQPHYYTVTDVNTNQSVEVDLRGVYINWESAVLQGKKKGIVTMIINNTGGGGSCFGDSYRSIDVIFSPSNPCGSEKLCSSQSIYGCVPGKKYSFNTLFGVYQEPHTDREWKYVWEKSKDNVTYYSDPTVQKRFLVNEKSINTNLSSSEISTLLGNDLVKDWTSVQTVYVRRRLEEWFKDFSCTGCALLGKTDWWDQDYQRTNSVALTMYKFKDPSTQNISISGPTTLSCGSSSVSYNLLDPSTGQPVYDPSALGITNIEWTIPSSWQGWSLSGAWATSIQPNLFKTYSPTTNLPQGGIVSVKLTYADGKVITQNITVNPPVSMTATVSASTVAPGSITSTNPLTASICAAGQATFTANVTSSTAYTASWVVENQGISDEGNTFLVQGTTLPATSYVNLTISDNNSACQITYSHVATIKVGNPGQGWAAYNFYASSVNNNAIDGSNIVTDQIGLPYFAVGQSGIWVWKYITNAWQNVKIVDNLYVDGELAIYQPSSTIEPVIYYTATNQAATQRFIYKLVRNGSVWTQQANPIYTFSSTAKVTLRTAPNGDIYFRQGTTISKLAATNGQVNGGTATVFTTNVLSDSKFAVSTNYVYYITSSSQFWIKETGNRAGSVQGTRVASTIQNPEPLVISTPSVVITDVQTDASGNGYYVSANGVIIQYYVAPIDKDPLPADGLNKYHATSNSVTCNGKFGVNYETGVIYLASDAKTKDGANNIWQIYNNANDGYWIAQNISPIAYSTGLINSQAAFKQYGTVAFSKNNAFYVSTYNNGSGNVKMITYNTAATCQPARTRLGEEEALDSDNLNRQVVVNEISENSISVFPNPVESNSTISYTLAEDAQVSLTLLNSMGEVVKTLVSDSQTVGAHSIELEKANLNSGLYFISLVANGKASTVKVIIK